MFVASLAVHLGVGLIAFFHFSGFSLSRPHPAAPSPAPALLLIAPQRILTAQPVSPSCAAPVSASLAKSALPVLPAVSSHPTAISSGSPDLAFETHSHSQLRQPSWESVMAPPTAPDLDASTGTVFILDVSGSMYEPVDGSTRLALARETLTRLLRALPDGTPFAVTVYAEKAKNSGPLVAATGATREAAVRLITEDFDCGGGTDLPAGLASAEQLHPGHLVLVTDGDLNAKPRALMADVARLLKDAGSPAFNILAIQPRVDVGDDVLLQRLAAEQSGAYAVELGDKKLLTSAKTAEAAR